MSLRSGSSAWAAQGREEEFRGHSIHVHARARRRPADSAAARLSLELLRLAALLELEPGLAALAFDFLGFGLSDKPRDHVYTLAWQADLAEELVARHAAGRTVFHFSPTTWEPRWRPSVRTRARAASSNGGSRAPCCSTARMILELASPTFGQQLLRSRVGADRRAAEPRRTSSGQQFGSIFFPEHPLTDEEEADHGR